MRVKNELYLRAGLEGGPIPDFIALAARVAPDAAAAYHTALEALGCAQSLFHRLTFITRTRAKAVECQGHRFVPVRPRARAACPSLARKRLHPHSMRHSTAVHLLQASVDLTTISHWLGHASVNTTNAYATIDLEMKREAIGKIRPITARSGRVPAWRADGSILAWLESL